jgi:hypothetical protein
MKNDRSFNRSDITPFDLYTDFGTKSHLLAIYYNVACTNWENTEKLIKHFPVHRRNAYLAEYFWKAGLQKKNEAGYVVSGDDVAIIQLLPEKLDAIRNFHSHIWHDNKVLRLQPLLKSFIERKFEEAKAGLFETDSGALMDYEKYAGKKDKYQLFKKVPEENAYYLTIEGRIFFLSFFLTAGQMNQFLQQSRGFKRADMPLFKMKRLLYTYYCHRDGASLINFGHSDEVLTNLPLEEKRDILRARTAYKLVNYLYDYPAYWGDKNYMPLLNEAGAVIETVQQLHAWLEANAAMLPGFRFSLVARKAPVAKPAFSNDELVLEKEQEEKVRSGTLSFTVQDIDGYVFHIAFDTLYRLLVLQQLYQLRPQGTAPVELLKESLQLQAGNRSRLYTILGKNEVARSGEEQDYLSDKKNQQLRGGRKLTELSIVFFEDLEKGRAASAATAIQLRNLIRPLNEKYISHTGRRMPAANDQVTGPDPIQVYSQDFISGTTQKFRPDNRFMLYATKYLVDFGNDELYWGVEKFEMRKKSDATETESLLKTKAYLHAAGILAGSDYRLTLEKDHVYLAVPRTAPTGTANFQQFHQFAIGPQAMRYLMAWAVQQNGDFCKDIQAFLIDLQADLELLGQHGEWKSDQPYRLLEAPFVMGFLKDRTSIDLEQLRHQVSNRIDTIIQGWNHAQQHKHQLSRAQKNRLVMDAYRFFDWPAGGNEVPRFLRANEYNGMSVCHYSLAFKRTYDDAPPHARQRQACKSKFQHLFRDVFKLDARKPPIPREIMRLLDEANSLDELLDLVLNDRRDMLLTKKKHLFAFPAAIQKKELPAFCRLLGISVPPHLLKQQEAERLKTKHEKTLQVQPFAIHPMLIVKRFFPEVYNGGRGAQSNYVPVFANLRKNAGYRKRLPADFYDTAYAMQWFPPADHKKRLEKLIGAMNITCTEDILLWQVAAAYLKNNHYTESLGELINNVPLGNRPIYDVLKLPIKIRLKPEAEGKDVYVAVLMHQLDDVLFRQEKSRLRRLADHFKHRVTGEGHLWQQQFAAMDKDLLGGSAPPTGGVHDPIPFKLLMYESDLIRKTGQRLAEKILYFEKAMYDRLLEKFRGDKHTLHQWIMARAKANDYYRSFHYAFFNFDDVLKVAAELGAGITEEERALLSDIRNHTFHNDVPVSGSYSWVTRTGERMREVLLIESDLHAVKDRTQYSRNEIVEFAMNNLGNNIPV